MSIETFGYEPEGATPLTDEDYKGLKPLWIASRPDLNQAEAINIGNAMDYFLNRKFSTDTILDDLFVRDLHRKMYGDVWSWAGAYRKSETNIGIRSKDIAVGVANLMADARYWLAEAKGEALDLVVTQIHHKLVSIHPFTNGNGRMCRFFADLLLIAAGRPPFTWGNGDLTNNSSARTSYIAALQKADQGDYESLSDFVKSSGR